MASVAIYVNRKGQQLGPYDYQQINRLLYDGELSPEDLGWHKGLKEWVPLGQLEALTNPVKDSSAKHVAVGASTGPVRNFATKHLSEEDQQFQAIGSCWYLVALALGALGTPILLYALPRLETTLTVIGTALLIGCFGYGMLGTTVRKNKPWAQPASTIGAILLIPFLPFGTIVGLYVLGLLKKSQKKTNDH